MTWNTLTIKSSRIINETEKAYLINIAPGYLGCTGSLQFWHPKKCCRFIGDGMMTVNYTDDWTFNMSNMSTGYVIGKMEIEGSELKDMVREDI